MEINIGKKIQTSRKESGLTQEQAAERLGVSRQTMSNWENEKSYPDIISVIKMSEIYNVSLDYLLKGEKAMGNYYDYLEESTNVVKSNNRKSRISLAIAYMTIWALTMIVFWFFTDGSDAMGFSLVFLWIILPVTTLVASVIIGINDFWGKWKWAVPVIMGVMYMLAEYGTFSMANNIAFGNHNAPQYAMIPIGLVISIIGILIGIVIKQSKNKKAS